MDKMDKESKRLVEIFFTLIFSGAIAYIITFISDPSIIENNTIWIISSIIILLISVGIIIFIFEIHYQIDNLLIARIFFICFSTLIIFSVTRFLSFCNDISNNNLIELLENSYNNILVLFSLLNFTLLMNSYWDKKFRKVIILVFIIIWCLIGFLFIIKNVIIYGVI